MVEAHANTRRSFDVIRQLSRRSYFIVKLDPMMLPISLTDRKEMPQIDRTVVTLMYDDRLKVVDDFGTVCDGDSYGLLDLHAGGVAVVEIGAWNDSGALKDYGEDLRSRAKGGREVDPPSRASGSTYE